MLMAKKNLKFLDDPFFDSLKAINPEWIISSIYKESQYTQPLWLKGTKYGNKAARNAFNYKESTIYYIARKLKEEHSFGLVRLTVYEYLEIKSGTTIYRIALGTKEQTITKQDYDCEYRYAEYGLVNAIKTIRRSCIEKLLPSDFLNETVNDWLEMVDAKER